MINHIFFNLYTEFDLQNKFKFVNDVNKFVDYKEYRMYSKNSIYYNLKDKIKIIRSTHESYIKIIVTVSPFIIKEGEIFIV